MRYSAIIAFSFAAVALAMPKSQPTCGTISSGTNQCCSGSCTVGVCNQYGFCECENGSYDNGSGRCAPCPQGSYCPQGQGPKPCPAGTFGQQKNFYDASQCTGCQPGYYSGSLGAANSNTCKKCPASQYSGTGYSQCVPCNGATSSQAAGQCDIKECPAGQEIQNGNCVNCPAGYYQPYENTTKQCQLCPAGTYQQYAGQPACYKCLQNQFSTQVGANDPGYCQNCPATGGKTCSNPGDTTCARKCQ